MDTDFCFGKLFKWVDVVCFMEEFLTVDSDDGHLIYGTLNSYEKKKDKLIIFVHGLSGNQHEHQYFNAVPFFCSRGYDVFRFNLYDSEDRARQLSECSISIHARDVNSVVENFKDKYDELFLVGHSFGCLAIMNANLEPIRKIIYWDPTCGFKSLEDKSITYDGSSGLYTLHWGIEMLANEELIREWKETSNVKEYARRLKGDCNFIFSSNKRFETGKDYVDGYKFIVIGGASHRFIEEGTLDKLFEETLKFLED